MQLGLYRTALAAARLSSVLRIFCLPKMTNRGMKSRPDGNSLKPHNNLAGADNEGNQPYMSNTSQVTYDEGYPLLSASVLNSMSKNKRRAGIDLETRSEQKSDKDVENVGSMQLEASTSISLENNDLGLPTSFGKKHASRSPKPRQTYHERGEAKRSSTFSPDINDDEPFDIFLPEVREASTSKSRVNKKNKGKWVPKAQPAEENGQHEHNMGEDNNVEHSDEEIGQVLGSGMVLLKRYIPVSEQVNIVNKCRELGLGPGGFYRPGYKDGAKLRLYMMCLGLDWDPQTKEYGEIRHLDNSAPPHIPNEFSSLVTKALNDSHNLIKKDLEETVNAEDILPRMSPDVCIVNFYTVNGRLGLHQDRDESRESLMKGLPVVSVSIGDSAEFLYGDQRDVNKAESVFLESGDVLIFGGECRHIFHGVTSIIPNTAPTALLENIKLRPGRLNLTFRKY